MTILSELIEKMKDDEKGNLQQIVELCDQIHEEEKENIKHHDHIPKGPNIFLVLEVPGRTIKEIGYLTLERESENLYLTVLYTISTQHVNATIKKQKVWEIDDHRPEKILTEYAKKYKYLRGE